MNVTLQGNDGLHLGIHQSADVQNWEPKATDALNSHIEQHQLKIQQEMQAQMAAMGGQLGIPTAGGTGTEVKGPGGGMGTPQGIPSPQGG